MQICKSDRSKLCKFWFQIITYRMNGDQADHAASINALKEVRTRPLANIIVFLVHILLKGLLLTLKKIRIGNVLF